MSEKTFKAPAGAKANAQKALDWKDKHGNEVKAMTPTGWARANQLAKGENLSYETVKRMSNFNRHRKNASVAPEHKDEPWKDNGHVAWLGWGGDAGVDWAMKVVDSEEKNEMKIADELNKIHEDRELKELESQFYAMNALMKKGKKDQIKHMAKKLTTKKGFKDAAKSFFKKLKDDAVELADYLLDLGSL